jgi:hypothetical protein
MAFPGKSEHYVPKPIQRPFSQKRVDQPEKLSESVFLVMFALSVLSTHWHMMSALEFGAAYLSVSVVD